ncbi:MAG: hypothetical protein ACFFCV_12530 [Promethearchaeota archaeon]
MPVTLGLLFHANFPFSMHYTIAYNSCYKHLPVIMRNYPNIPVNWHLSATLLQQLAWKNPETIQVFRKGLQDNQFELLGSSYAQNILYNCSEWVNREQIKWNRSIIHNFFPELNNLNGFWNPERVFYEDMFDLLLDYDYNYTLVENQIIKSAIKPTNLTVDHIWKRNVKKTGSSFYIFPDNQVLKDLIDKVIETGKTEELIRFLDKNVESDSERKVFCYAEDAEVSGFWQIARGMDYKKVHENLKKLLGELTENKWIKVKLFSDIIKEEKSYEIGSIPNGQATWMIDSVKVDGYRDWFDYIEQAPEIQYYKEYYEKVEQKIRTLPNKLRKRNLTNELLKYYLSQQFEFGCSPGSFGDLASRYLMNVPGMQIWDDRVTIDTIFDWLSSGDKKFKPHWKFRGASPVIEFSTLKWICQFNPFGGRCTFLMNREIDSIFSPNPFYSSQDRNVMFNSLPYLKVHLNYSGIEDLINNHGNCLMDNCYVNNEPIGDLMEYKVVLNRNGRRYIMKKSLQHSLFNSLILPKEDSIRFWYSELGISVIKEIKEIDSNIEILYTFKNLSEETKTIKFTVTNEFAPEPVLVLENGKECLKLEIEQEKSRTKIITTNIITNSKVLIVTSVKPNEIKKIPSEFALRYKLIFQFKLDKEGLKSIPLIMR